MFTPARLAVLLVGLAPALFIVAHSSADNGPNGSAATTDSSSPDASATAGEPAASEVAEAEEAADAAGAVGDDWPDVRSISSFNDGALDEIKGCIANLGHADFKVRSAAEERLIEIGRPARAHLQEAVGSDDPEVAFRAGRALEAIEKTRRTDQQMRRQLRIMARRAADCGDYQAAARDLISMIRLAPPALADICELGLVCEMAGRWEDAAIAYGLAAAKAEVWREASNSKPGSWNGKIPEAPYDFSEWSYADGRWRKVADSPFPPEKLDQSQKQLLNESRGTDSSWDNERYSRLMLLLGRIQRDRLNDATAAAKSFASGARYFRRHEDNDAKALATLYNIRTAALADGKLVAPREAHAPRHPNWLLCLLELAAIEEQADRPAEALAAWGRINMAAANYKFHRDPVDHQAIARLAAQLPDDQPLPPGVPLIRLSAGNPHWTFNLADAETISHVRRWPSDAPPKFTFALVAPESAQFESLEISCQFGEAVSGANLDAGLLIRVEAQMQRQFWTTAAPVGEVCIDAQTPDERQVTRNFDVPPGAGVVQLGIGGWDARTIQSVTVKARFAPAAAKEQPASYIAGHGYPEGGKLTIDGREFEGQVLRQAVVEPGRHLLQYVGPDAKAKMQIEADLRPGQVYAFAALLDSPFTVRQTNLPAVDPRADDQFANCSLVQLGNGRWLAAWESRGRIMLALSDDLQRWSEPHPLPLMVTANETAPTLVCDGSGGAWISWISDRTSLTILGRKALVMAHTADGVKWDPPHVIIAPGNVKKPPQLVNIGSQWQLYYGGCRYLADSPDKIEKFQSVTVAGSLPDEAHVAIDDTGCKHMVFVKAKSANMAYRTGGRISHATSADGKTWNNSTDLFGTARDDGQFSNPQLIIRGERMLLFYEEDGDLYLRRADLAEQPKFGAAVRLTGGAMRPKGTRPAVTADGKVVFLCGPHGVWLLQADLKKLLADDDAPQPAAAAADASAVSATASNGEAAAGNRWKIFTWAQARRGRIVAADRHAIWLREFGRITRYDQKSRQLRHFTVADGLPLGSNSSSQLYADGKGGCFYYHFNPIRVYLFGPQGWVQLPQPVLAGMPQYIDTGIDIDGTPLLMITYDHKSKNRCDLLGFSVEENQWRKIRELPAKSYEFIPLHEGYVSWSEKKLLLHPRDMSKDVVEIGLRPYDGLCLIRIAGTFLHCYLKHQLTAEGIVPIKEPVFIDIASSKLLPLKVTVPKTGPGCLESDLFGTIEVTGLVSYQRPFVLRDMNGDIWLDGRLVKSDKTVQPSIPDNAMRDLYDPQRYRWDDQKQCFVRRVPAEFADFSAWDEETQCAWVIRDPKDKSVEYRDFSGPQSKLLRTITRGRNWSLPQFVDRQGNWWLLIHGRGTTVVRIDPEGRTKKITFPDGRRLSNSSFMISPLTGAVWSYTSTDPKNKAASNEGQYKYVYLNQGGDEFVISDEPPWDDFAFSVGLYELSAFQFSASFWRNSCYRRCTDGRWRRWEHQSSTGTSRSMVITANAHRGGRLLVKTGLAIWEYDGDGDRWICLAGGKTFKAHFDEKGRRILADNGSYCLIYEGDPFDDPHADVVSNPKLQQETRHLLDLARAAHPLMRQEIVRRFVGLPAVSAMIVDSYRERGLIDEALAAELFEVISKDLPPGLFELAHPPCPVLGQ